MGRSIRRQLRMLQIYAATTFLVFAGLALTGFRQTAKPQNLGEITAERINIVDANGTLRLVISNKDRMHPGIIGGKMLKRPRPYAGLIFFNDLGDEAGGLTLAARQGGEQRVADTSLNFDQLGQDQTIGFGYSEVNGQRTAAFKVWDRPETPLADVIEKMNAANAIRDPAERDAALAKLKAAIPPGVERVFVGKTRDRIARVMLADAHGRDRLALKVDADGNASIEFLDEAGNVVQRVGPAR